MPLFKRIFSGWLYRFVVKVLQCGPIPRHIAFIMDGNRRYAKKSDIPRIEGYSSGYEKIMGVLDWCLDIGIAEISLYAFSIENFKRSEEEVQELMALLLEKFQDILNQKEEMEEKGYCFRIFGDLSLLPASIQQTVAKLNLCMWNNISDITEEFFEACFYASDSSPVDLLVRTSGEVRLSDFLLWQSSDSVLVFSKPTWPEISVWNLFACIFCYQHCERVKKRINRAPPKIKISESCDFRETELEDLQNSTSSSCSEVDTRA